MRAVNEDAALGIGCKGGLIEELRAEQIAPGTVLADIAVHVQGVQNTVNRSLVEAEARADLPQREFGVRDVKAV